MFRRIRTIIAVALVCAAAAGAQAEPPYVIEWTRQLGTSERDCSFGVAADPLGNVFISGFTWGSLGGPNAGDVDAFVSKYDSSGSLLWTRQLGTSSYDRSRGGVAADPLGNVFISGWTSGSLGGPSAGDRDAFVSKYDPVAGQGRQAGPGADADGGRRRLGTPADLAAPPPRGRGPAGGDPDISAGG